MRETCLFKYTPQRSVTYDVCLEFLGNPKSELVQINGARLYRSGKYVGWWPGWQIPRTLKKHWAHLIEEELIEVREMIGGDKG